ncbi:peptide ABC transporter substrate-binding protein [Bradyrhizobium japonicum]|uniref:peptide ABC transporter substrate-binding protein n=1 Tax=Bradyrhizobium japonicum TaxID=375 RepID=UPI00068F5AC2|nr:peptide ABC transporter substrate-binding protein [Bradyrhizobium japonicum]MCD9110928.1 peptide ABC transporter substrate-binding protein [Bradyrhizobium japonicum]MCD9258909.1 peptide ABC transporter substrate-binding protein [Bradyrhizobium japonicum SEMIA 5079]MCD9822720.1 peptide ABC transporter substrate-binding protein [Bradyrhizobium japonicum]MCD9894754.1 peptide ABC transporter substrate-binding protein [Bradyrhizobium japonicum]MCD9911372.1 peptide ABC transporter substrate-bindi
MSPTLLRRQFVSAPPAWPQLQSMIDEVKDGDLDRRTFIRRMIGLGLTAPMAAQVLALGGVAMAQSISPYKPTKRGGGGPLKLLWWQGPTLLNPHFGVGTKDQDGSRLFYEPLASWDPEGNLSLILAAEIPSIQNGGLSPDGKSVTWKLKPGVKWHDGKPFTADDVVFNWQYAKDPATAAVTIAIFRDITVEKVEDLTVRILFDKPTPFWANAFVGPYGAIIPKHLFANYAGVQSREAPNNLKPVGTGPYKFVEFKPGDLIRGELNSDYHMPNRPYFDSIEMKGGGDAVSAARAVIQTGEYDYASNIQVEDEVLLRLEKGGTGKTIYAVGADIETIFLNLSDPNTEVDGERSSLKTKHPLFSDPAGRKALSMLVDRDAVQKVIYGRAGRATANFFNGLPQFVSKNTSWEFNIEKAAKLLGEAGWKPGVDSIREKDGKKLKLIFQTSINGPRQKTQAIVKQACQKAGIDVELKSVVASVFFSSDAANPDTMNKFYADIEMSAFLGSPPDPDRFLSSFHSRNIPSKENKWQGFNLPRYASQEYDATIDAAKVEIDPVKRASLYIKANDLLWQDAVLIPVIHRLKVAASSNSLRVVVSGWGTDTDHLQDWYREAT